MANFYKWIGNLAQNILLVKLSSLGDVVHSFAAVSDMAAQADARITWAVEEAFAPLASRHPAVDKVVAVPMRRLRKHSRLWWRSAEWRQVIAALRAQEYAAVIDAQGLIKSAVLAHLASPAPHCGYDWQSAREGWASLFYQHKAQVPRRQHAVLRTRQLCASALAYALPPTEDFALPQWQGRQSRDLVFLHGTTWASKLLPESTWLELIFLAQQSGYRVRLLWGNTEEEARAQRLAAASQAEVAAKMALPEIAQLLRESAAVLSVDTGLGHLAAAQGVPVLGLFAATDAALSGMRGARAENLSRPRPCMKKDCRRHGAATANACMAAWSADEIWTAFQDTIQRVSS